MFSIRNFFSKTLSVILIFLLLLPGLVLATEYSESKVFLDHYLKQNQILIKANEVVKGPVLYLGDNIQIDGIIDGSVIAAGRRVAINGEIKGDLLTGAEKVTINGIINGDLYSGAQEININGTVTGMVVGGAKDIIIAKEAVLSKDLLAGAANIIHSGLIKRQFLGGGENIIINGIVKDDVKVGVKNLQIAEGAEISGYFSYESPYEALISPQADIKGHTQWFKFTPEKVKKKDPTVLGSLFSLLWGLAAALLIWFLVALWRPQAWVNLAQTLNNKPLKTIGLGALTLILTPILIILLTITIVGIPLGIILTLGYGLFIYLAKIVTAVFIGGKLAERFSWPVLHKGFWLVLLGLAIIALITEIPFVGFLLTLIVIFAGLGSFTFGLWDARS